MTSATTTLENWLLRMEEPPWNLLYRAAIGFWILPTFARLGGRNGSDWAFTAFFLGVLFLLRVVPAILRRLIGFTDAAQAIWVARRRATKRYDSYQWQKLFGFGLGLALWMAVSGDLSMPRVMLASACLSCGAAGLIVWRVKHAEHPIAL